MNSHQLEKCINKGTVKELRAALNNNPELIEYHDFLGHTVLQKAVLANRIDICEELIELGADINEKGRRGQFALNVACSKGHVDIAKLLLLRGADPSLGRTLFAAANCKVEIGLKLADLLISHGVNINKVFLIFDNPNDKKTALDFAANRPELRELLLKHGAKSASEIPYTPDLQER